VALTPRTGLQAFEREIQPLGLQVDILTTTSLGLLGYIHGLRDLEEGKEADLIAVDPSLTAPLPGAGADDKPVEIVSRLMFRTHPLMVRGAWVRGKLLPANTEGGDPA
jgi:cytosine/adenosine deaminase-related metal-dependent hydrolase